MGSIFGTMGAHDDLAGRLSAMGAALAHHEWFMVDHEVCVPGQVGLGRAGIGIFNRGPQPVWNADRTIALVLVGEFELLDSSGPGLPDAVPDEVLALALYERFGPSFATHISGAFSIALWDARQQRVVVTVDRQGTCPVYWAQYRGRLVFASEMKAILLDPQFNRRLDPVALAEYMRFQILFGDRTFFEGISLLPEGSYLVYDLAAERASITRYWNLLDVEQQPRISFDEAVEECARLLKTAINRHAARGNYRIGAYLSGGADSRTILGLMAREHFPLPTVTYGLKTSRDALYARQIAEQAGATHHYFEFENGRWIAEYADLHLHLTEGFHSWIHSHGISIAHLVRQLFEVNLTGFGGDDYDWRYATLNRAQDDTGFMAQLFYALNQEITWPSATEAEERMLYAPGMAGQMVGLAFESLHAEFQKHRGHPYEQIAKYLYYQTDRRMFQYFTVFHRAYFEQRFPFRDDAYISFMFSLPPEYTNYRRLRRALILKYLPRLASIPYDKDDMPITNSQLRQMSARLQKKGKSLINRAVAPVFAQSTTLYADYENWLRGELRPWGEALLLDERTLNRGLFNPDFVRSIWARHLSGHELHTIGKVAPIMTLEMLLRKYMD